MKKTCSGPRPSTFHIKLLDLGLARLSLDPSLTTEPTAENQTFGTPDYMAPEQWQDAHNADARSDLYSLGCTLFYLLAGRAPFGTEQCKSLANKMTAHLTGTMPDLAALRADVPPRSLRDLSKADRQEPARSLSIRRRRRDRAGPVDDSRRVARCLQSSHRRSSR